MKKYFLLFDYQEKNRCKADDHMAIIDHPVHEKINILGAQYEDKLLVNICTLSH